MLYTKKEQAITVVVRSIVLIYLTTNVFVARALPQDDIDALWRRRLGTDTVVRRFPAVHNEAHRVAANEAVAEGHSKTSKPTDEVSSKTKKEKSSKESEPFVSPTVNDSPRIINGVDGTPISKRLYDFQLDEDEKLSATTRVDLSSPHDLPHYDHRAGRVDFHQGDFTPAPQYGCTPYDGCVESVPYFGKHINPTERPWVELGRGLYLNGPIPPSQSWLGDKNLVAPHFLLYGDFRTAVAYNDNGGSSQFVNAYRLNLDLDLKLTATERLHAFIGPIDRGANITRFVADNGDITFFEEFDVDFDNFFFEGDLGAILASALDIYSPFDMPIALGIMPMLFQNGNWILDNFLGVAATIPARHNSMLQWSNYDVTFFAGFDEIDSPAFPGDNSQGEIYGVHAAIEAYQGYLEVGYAFLNDDLSQGLGYHNVGVSYSRRYFQNLSNSIRMIANFGQDPVAGEQTADGQLILIENSWITSDYTHVVPYMNLFAGFDRPQSVARAAGVGGVLLNTGINFETDGLTGFPRLDDSANNTFGGAVGLNLLGPDLRWQLVTEFAMLATHGSRDNRIAPGNQYGFGARFQRPLTNSWIFRTDGMYGIRDQLGDIFGTRVELRYKF